MQLQPSLTSDTARAKRLGVSLLERLYYLYPADWPTKVLYCTVLYCTVLCTVLYCNCTVLYCTAP